MIYEYLNRTLEPEPDLCFVLLPFNERGDRLFEYGIRPAAESLNMRCRRADHHISSAPIMFQIFDDILRAQVVVADITEPNPNVYYELGIAHSQKRHVILLCQEGADVPFDVHGVRHVSYDFQKWGEQDRLRESLREALLEILRNVTEPPGLKETQALLQRARRTWLATRDIVLSFERYLEIGLALGQLDIKADDLAFLAHAGAHFGRFMGALCSTAGSRREFVRQLVLQAASDQYVRVGWRAAIMLEHCDSALVAEEMKLYAGRIENPHLYPDAIRSKTVMAQLRVALDAPDLAREERYKLIEVWKQAAAEFGVTDPAA